MRPSHCRTVPLHRLLALCLLTLLAAHGAWAETQLEPAFEALRGRDFSAKEQAIGQIADSGHPQARALLTTLLAGELYYRKPDGHIVHAERTDGGYVLHDALTGEALGEAGRREVKKIAINNQLRSLLAAQIARLDLSDPDAARRLQAVQAMSEQLSPDTAALLRELQTGERDDTVRAAIREALALSDLRSAAPQARLQAAQALSGSLHPQARIRLAELVAVDDRGVPLEADAQLRAAAQASLDAIDRRLRLLELSEMLFFGLSLGSVLLLAAIGLAITFGVMGVINMAHGELIMLGAYTAYVLQLLLPNHIGLALLLAVPAAFVVSGLAGIAIERGVVRFLYGRPLETLLATFGLSLMLQQLVRSIFSPLNRAVASPDWLSGSVELFGVLPVTSNRLYILLFSLLVFAALQALLRFTRLGLEVRAVSQNRAMARCMGIRSEWVDAATFGLGAGVAGIAGVALSQLTNVGPNLGQAYIIDSFLVVVFGGVGNLWGTLVGAFSLGVANKVLEPWSGAVLAKILVLVFIILFIQRRPRGLFPQRGRAAQG